MEPPIVGFQASESMFLGIKKPVFSWKKVCFKGKKALFCGLKEALYDRKVPLYVWKHGFGASVAIYFPLLLFYFICKDFAIYLCISEKASLHFILFHRPCLLGERNDSQAIRKSKCQCVILFAMLKVVASTIGRRTPTFPSAFLC